MYFVTAENIEKSLVDLARPGVIVVEDLVSDRVFIEAVVNAAKDSRVERALISGWLEVRHAGGGGRVVAVAKDEAEKFQGPMRVAAIIDSDSLFPGHQTQSHANATRLVTLGIYCHVLKHREIENYIPNRALSAIRPYTKTHKRLLALKTFTKVQRAHFDFKKGFGSRGERFERLPREHQNLYDGVSLQVMNELEDGFGENVIECLQKVSSLISMQDFSSVGEGVRQELDDLLSMIQSLI